MGHVLTGDQSRTAFRKLSEIARQFGQAEYPYDPNQALAILQAVSEGRFGAFPSVLFAADLIPKGYTVLEDVEPIADLKVEDLEFLGFLEQGEKNVNGMVMRDRAKMDLSANLGLVDGKNILAQQAKIPADVQFIVLSGTLLRSSAGRLYVVYLYRHVDQWHMGFHWLDCAWDGRNRLGRRKSRT